MKKHLIIGGGNLGLDLAAEIRRQGEHAELLTRANGFDIRKVPQLVRQVNRPDVDVLWYCVGFGTVAEAKAAETTDIAEFVHYTVPTILAKFAASHVRLVVFSSDHAADEAHADRTARHNPTPRSHYAALKVKMERTLRYFDRPQTAIVRIGSLYGVHKPQETFPGKVLRSFAGSDMIISLPENLVTPTSTMWLAWLLITHQDSLFSDMGATLHHAAPDGNVSVRDWAIMILEGVRGLSAFDQAQLFDDERPHYSALSCSIGVQRWHWHDVWKHYFRHAWFTPKALHHALPKHRRLPARRETEA